MMQHNNMKNAIVRMLTQYAMQLTTYKINKFPLNKVRYFPPTSEGKTSPSSLAI